MKTERLGFSRWREEDLPLAELLWGDEAVTRYICASGRFTKADVEARLAKEIENGRTAGIQYWPVFLLETEELVGCCGLRPYKEGQPEFGIHLREKFWGSGYGQEAARAVIRRAFEELQAESIFAGCHPNNMASKKLLGRLGFRYVREEFYAPTGLMHPSYVLEKEDIMENKDSIIRLEREEDHRAVENMIRESFWNVYRPGCSEHYVMHVLREDPAFVKELDFVMEQDGELIGQNMFMKTVIEADDGRTVDVLTMGPICVRQDLKRKGYGKKLLDYSMEKAAELGFGAVLFEGNILFYGKSGFDYARKFGIRYHDLPEGADDSFFLCRELIPGYLDDVTGVYQTPQGYYVKDEEVEAFDRDFPPKVKLKLPGQLI